MPQHDDETLTFADQETKALPHTLSETRHLTLTLLEHDADAGTAVFELRNPEAQPDEMVSELIEEHEEDAEGANRWRERLHLPEKPVPVDTSTSARERIETHLDEKLQIGDRVWTVAEITADHVGLTPGRDHETDSLVNTVEDLGYGAGSQPAAEGATRIDEAL